MALGMKATGKMTCSTEMERRLGLMVQFMRASIRLARNTAGAYIPGTMAADTKESGLRIRYVASAHTLG
jgi:hypothetical protein